MTAEPLSTRRHLTMSEEPRLSHRCPEPAPLRESALPENGCLPEQGPLPDSDAPPDRLPRIRPLRTVPVEEAAAAAMTPPGPQRWFSRPTDEGMELRTVVRRWSSVPEQPARISRIACGAALRAARLAVAVQGREALVSRPEEEGLVVVLRAGRAVDPHPEDLIRYAVLHDLHRGGGPRRRRIDPALARAQLRRAAEAEGAWVRTCGCTREPAHLPVHGTRWSIPGGPVVMRLAVGSPGQYPASDLRLGQAVEAVRLTAAAFGLGVAVAGFPAPSMSAPDTVAVLEIWRPMPVPVDLGAGADRG